MQLVSSTGQHAMLTKLSVLLCFLSKPVRFASAPFSVTDCISNVDQPPRKFMPLLWGIQGREYGQSVQIHHHNWKSSPSLLRADYSHLSHRQHKTNILAKLYNAVSFISSSTTREKVYITMRRGEIPQKEEEKKKIYIYMLR